MWLVKRYVNGRTGPTTAPPSSSQTHHEPKAATGATQNIQPPFHLPPHLIPSLLSSIHGLPVTRETNPAMEGPPQPQAILRGHAAQVHAACFIRGNERLVTGDAEGFVVVWDLKIMRARAVWRAHQKTILGIEEWGPGRLITYVLSTVDGS